MKITVTIRGEFSCDKGRAFRAPILGDATQFLDGCFLQPPVVGFEDDQTWGQVGGVRFPVTSGNLFCPAGRLFEDRILSRVENEYWSWSIYDFQIPSLFFVERAVGEWRVSEIDSSCTAVCYSYTFYSKHRIFDPLTWLFVQTQWRMMMNRALPGIRAQAESKGPLYYEGRGL